MGRSAVAAALAAGLAALGFAGCAATDGTDSADTGSATLGVYVSLPLQGVQGRASAGLLDGAKLALAQAGGRAGPFTVKLAALDDSTSGAGTWEPDATAANARRALTDRTSVAYIGDADAGATATSLPLTNAAGILQVVPATTYAGLTTTGAGALIAPSTYRPSGAQSLVRVVPTDVGQVAALDALRARAGCERVALVADAGLGPEALARGIRAATPDGVRVVARATVSSAAQATAAATRLGRLDADCAIYAAGPSPWSADLLDALHAAAPERDLIGSDGAASPGVLAALAPGTQQRLAVASSAPADPPAAFGAAYGASYGHAPTPTAIRGYEAMRVVLAAVRAAGPQGGNRRAVRRAATTARGITPGGDVAGERWSVGRVRAGALADVRRAPASAAR